MEAFSGQDLSVAVAGNSIANPAESANGGMLAVGAADWATPTTIELFSSQGPTEDGRTKPDIVGVDRGDSVSYGANGFAGTSQASPHVAGMAALVLDQFPSFTPAQIADYLKANALGQGAVPNNTWGYGLAKLPALSPDPPTNAVAAVGGDRKADVTWHAPVADGGSAIIGYTVTSDPDGKTAVVGGSTLSATVTGLTVGTTYTFTATATNDAGTSAASGPSNAIIAVGVPDPPTNVTATPDDAQAMVSWTAPASDGGSPITVYTVTASPGGLTAVATSTLSATVSGLTNGTGYTFTVTATNAIGTGSPSAPSNEATPVNPPPVVTAGSDLSVDEGQAISQQLATFTDPEPPDVHTATVDWGDGTVATGTVSEVGGTVSGTHTYADNGTFAVTVTVNDDEGGSDSDSLTVVVANVPPTVNAGPDQFLGNVGTTTLEATFSDQGTGDTHTAVVDWGDGAIEQVTPVEGSHEYTDPGLYTVTISVADDDGGTGVDSLVVAIPGITAWGLLGLALALGLLTTAYVARRRPA